MTSYAITAAYLNAALSIKESPHKPLKTQRPLKAEKIRVPGKGEHWLVHDPLGKDQIWPLDRGVNRGRWQDLSPFSLGNGKVTWEQYANHHLGQILKQNELAARLRALGIDREDESYLPIESDSLYKQQFWFTFDELEKLLDQIPEMP
jgi:hypothetical protein